MWVGSGQPLSTPCHPSHTGGTGVSSCLWIFSTHAIFPTCTSWGINYYWIDITLPRMELSIMVLWKINANHEKCQESSTCSTQINTSCTQDIVAVLLFQSPIAIMRDIILSHNSPEIQWNHIISSSRMGLRFIVLKASQRVRRRGTRKFRGQDHNK